MVHASCMAGITAAIAETNLQLYLDAQATVATGRSFTVGDRVLSMHNLDEIRGMIDFWDRRCRRLSRGSGVAVGRVIVND